MSSSIEVVDDSDLPGRFFEVFAKTLQGAAVEGKIATGWAIVKTNKESRELRLKRSFFFNSIPLPFQSTSWFIEPSSFLVLRCVARPLHELLVEETSLCSDLAKLIEEYSGRLTDLYTEEIPFTCGLVENFYFNDRPTFCCLQTVENSILQRSDISQWLKQCAAQHFQRQFQFRLLDPQTGEFDELEIPAETFELQGNFSIESETICITKIKAFHVGQFSILVSELYGLCENPKSSGTFCLPAAGLTATVKGKLKISNLLRGYREEKKEENRRKPSDGEEIQCFIHFKGSFPLDVEATRVRKFL